jgi:hypothetical protein
VWGISGEDRRGGIGVGFAVLVGSAGCGCLGCGFGLPRPRRSPPMETGGSDRSMVVLVSGILLLGGIALFIGWGLTHAYPGA